MEQIQYAAIKQDGEVFTGRHHDGIEKQILIRTKKNPYGMKGFLTSRSRFVDRKEAGQIALKAGQIKKPNLDLHSEDLWE